MYLLTVGQNYCVMRFAYALYTHRQNLVLLSCLYTEPSELVIRACDRDRVLPPAGARRYEANYRGIEGEHRAQCARVRR